MVVVVVAEVVKGWAQKWGFRVAVLQSRPPGFVPRGGPKPFVIGPFGPYLVLSSRVDREQIKSVQWTMHHVCIEYMCVCVGAERVWGVDATSMVSFQIVGPRRI